MQVPKTSPGKSFVRLNRSTSKLLLLAVFVAGSVALLPATLKRAGTVKAAAPSHVIFLPYYTTKAGWDSVLTLNNATHGPLSAGLTLYSLEGEALAVPE